MGFKAVIQKSERIYADIVYCGEQYRVWEDGAAEYWAPARPGSLNGAWVSFIHGDTDYDDVVPAGLYAIERTKEKGLI